MIAEIDKGSPYLNMTFMFFTISGLSSFSLCSFL